MLQTQRILVETKQTFHLCVKEEERMKVLQTNANCLVWQCLSCSKNKVKRNIDFYIETLKTLPLHSCYPLRGILGQQRKEEEKNFENHLRLFLFVNFIFAELFWKQIYLYRFLKTCFRYQWNVLVRLVKRSAIYYWHLFSILNICQHTNLIR
jgi:hypothetical protein